MIHFLSFHSVSSHHCLPHMSQVHFRRGFSQHGPCYPTCSFSSDMQSMFSSSSSKSLYSSSSQLSNISRSKMTEARSLLTLSDALSSEKRPSKNHSASGLYIMNMVSVFHCCFKGFCPISKKRIFHYTKACWFWFKMLKFYTESNCFYQGSSHEMFCQHLSQLTGKGYLLICVEKFIWVDKMLLNSSIF